MYYGVIFFSIGSYYSVIKLKINFRIIVHLSYFFYAVNFFYVFYAVNYEMNEDIMLIMIIIIIVLFIIYLW